MADLLVDTDVFIDHLRGTAPLQAGRNRLFYSVVTRAELFAGKGTNEDTIQQVLSPFVEIAVDRAIAEEAGRIRRRSRMALPDALIAATAGSRRLTILTRSQRHFRLASGIRVRSP